MVYRLITLFLLLWTPVIQLFAGELPHGFQFATNVGNPALSGKFLFEEKNDCWILKGSGNNIWNSRDEFFYLSRLMQDDCMVSGFISFSAEGVEPHRKAGLMFRESLDEDAPYVDVALHGNGLLSLQYRAEKGGLSHEVATQVKSPAFVQLEKSGHTFILRVSKDQTPLDEVASVNIPFGEHFHTGMFVCAHNPGIMEEARFRNVRVDIPAEARGGLKAPPSYSRLEILDVLSDTRKVVYSSEEHFEAPNWSGNGKFLIFNQGGKLYRFTLKNKNIRQINTGFADANNNDHGISFDGKMLAISHQLQEGSGRRSIIYTVPVKGGIPLRITPLGPSYWHGWSPDGKWLTPVDHCRGTRRRSGIFARREVDLFQFGTEQYHADLADETRWFRSGAGDQ